MERSETERDEEKNRRDARRRVEMEEEIIGNRWKELDYDGYYLVTSLHSASGSVGFLSLISSLSIHRAKRLEGAR